MATLTPQQQDELRSDLGAMSDQIHLGLSPSRVRGAASTWRMWTKFCADMGHDPGLSDFQDPAPVLHLFGHRVRDGRHAPMGKPVSARHAEDATRQVAQAFSMVGAPDPRLNPVTGKMDARLTRVFHGWKRSSGPAKRRKPTPRAVLDASSRHAERFPTRQYQLLRDLMWLGFFFLLRPGEYLRTTNGKTPLTLGDVLFKCDGREYVATDIPYHALGRVSSAGIRFQMQKNGVSGDVLLHGTTGDTIACPKNVLVRIVRHLREHGATADTPLYTFWDDSGIKRNAADRNLAAFLRLGAASLNLDCETTAGSLRATGASALLAANTPIPLIKLMGRWRSDEVFRYLHLQTESLTASYASNMLQAAP